MEISSLDKKLHDRKKFDCEVSALNTFLQTQSTQGDKKSLSRTFVLTSKTCPSEIIGYYTLATCIVDVSQLPEQLKKTYKNNDHISCALIGRLAVDKNYQRQGIGSLLLVDAIRQAVNASSVIPTPMIIIDARTDDVAKWYQEFSFTSFPHESKKLMLPMKNAKELLEYTQ